MLLCSCRYPALPAGSGARKASSATELPAQYEFKNSSDNVSPQAVVTRASPMSPLAELAFPSKDGDTRNSTTAHTAASTGIGTQRDADKDRQQAKVKEEMAGIGTQNHHPIDKDVRYNEAATTEDVIGIGTQNHTPMKAKGFPISSLTNAARPRVRGVNPTLWKAEDDTGGIGTRRLSKEKPKANSFLKHAKNLSMVAMLILTITAICYMHHEHRDRGPPIWGPHMQDQFPFRRWTREVMLWSIREEMPAARKAAWVATNLRGGAKELIDTLPPQAILNGGLINGVNVAPMTFLLHSLSERYSALGEESRMKAMVEMMNLSSQPREKIDDMLTRFDIVRHRASIEGNLGMNTQATSWILLRACRCSDEQLMRLLQPTNGLFPANDAEYSQLCIQLRRVGHILENNTGNIASLLRNNNPNATPTFFQNVIEDSNHTTSAYMMDVGEPGHNYSLVPQQDMFSPMTGTYYGEEAELDSGTDSDTISSLGDTLHPPASGSTQEAGQEIFWAYQQAKSRWRQYMNKPTRKVRRFVRGKGKSKGKGRLPTHGHRSVNTFLTNIHAAGQTSSVFFGKSKGKGKKGKSSGLGFGRRKNPKGKDGKTMECHNCGSDEHLIRDCPKQPTSSGTLTIQRADQSNQNVGYMSGNQENPWTQWFGMMESGSAPEPSQTRLGSVPGENRNQESRQYEDFTEGPLMGVVSESRSSAVSILMIQQGQPSMPPTPMVPNFMQDSVGFSGIDPWTTALQNGIAMPVPSTPQIDHPMTDVWQEWSETHTRTITGNASPMPAPQPTPTRSTAIGGPWGVSGIPATDAACENQERRISASPGQVELIHMPYYTAPVIPGVPVVQMLPACPRVEMPEFTQHATFSYLRTGEVPELKPQDQLSPLWGGATGGEAPSTLEPGQQEPTNQMHFIETQLKMPADQRGTSNLTVPTTNTCETSQSFLSDFKMIQDCAEEQRLAKEAAKGKGRDRRRPTPSDPMPPTPPELQSLQSQFQARHGPDYLGTDTMCSVCMMEFEEAEVVVRLVCRHQFHIECYNDYIGSEQRSERPQSCCPNCRGAAVIASRYRYIAHAQSEGGRSVHSGTPSGPVPTLPWVPAGNCDQPQGYYHARTALSSGKLALLIDIGAWTSVGGAQRGKELAAKALKAGYKPKQKKMDRPLEIQGVGHGTQKGNFKATLPIAVTTETGESVMYDYEVPLIEKSSPTDTGDQLPLILGLKSMKNKNAVLELQDGKETLTFPGPGRYTVNWSPGTVRIPMEAAMSGHLMVGCTNYDKLPRQRGGVEATTDTLHATPADVDEKIEQDRYLSKAATHQEVRQDRYLPGAVTYQ